MLDDIWGAGFAQHFQVATRVTEGFSSHHGLLVLRLAEKSEGHSFPRLCFCFRGIAWRPTCLAMHVLFHAALFLFHMAVA